MADLNTTFIISLAIIILGYLLKRAKIVDQEHGGKAMAKLIFYVTLPAVILNALTTIEMDVSMALMPLFAPLISGVIIVIAFFIHRKEERREDQGLYIMMSLGFNVGNFGFPLIQGIFGEEGIKYAAMYDVGNALIIFCVCYIIAVYYSPREGEKVHLRLIAKKVITSPPLLAYIIALLFNGFNLSFPWLVQEIVGVIAKANHFITYLVLGIYLNLKLEKHHWLKIFKVLGTRYGVGLGLGLLFYFILPINELARTVLLICYIIPVGMALLVYVVQYDYNENFAGMLSNLNIIISFGLMWFILFLINL